MVTQLSETRLDPSTIRDDFPILARTVASGADLVYLDNAASTQRPQQVIDAMADFERQHYANVHRGIHTLSEEATSKYEDARHTVAGFLGASDAHEIVFTAGTTAAINTVAQTWGVQHLQENDVILLPISEHHANIVPWHQLAARVGCRVEWLDLNDDFLISESRLAERLAALRPKLFAFGAASNTLGTEYPVATWTRLAREVGATVLVDAAQAVPHQVVDVQAWDADFIAFSGHKLCGPSGIGVLHAKSSHLESMPPFLGGGGMIHQVTRDGFTAAKVPEKFEAGTPPITQAVGLAAAMDYISKIGRDTIHAHECQLSQIADAGLREIDGLRVIGPDVQHRAGITSFVIDGIHAHDISQSLDLDGVAVRAGHHCTMPLHESLNLTMSCRASFYLYNTAQEAERLVEAVRATVKRFRRRKSR